MSGEHVRRMKAHLSYAACSTWMRVEYLAWAEEVPSTCILEPGTMQEIC